MAGAANEELIESIDGGLGGDFTGERLPCLKTLKQKKTKLQTLDQRFKCSACDTDSCKAPQQHLHRQP